MNSSDKDKDVNDDYVWQDQEKQKRPGLRVRLNRALLRVVFGPNGPREYEAKRLANSEVHIVRVEEDDLESPEGPWQGDPTRMVGACGRSFPIMIVRGDRANATYYDPKALVVLFHGTRHDASLHVRAARIMAYNLVSDIMVVEYPGFGPGAILERYPPGFEGALAYVTAAWRYACQRLGKDPSRMVFYGKSIGSALCASLASSLPEDAQPAAILLHSSFIGWRAAACTLSPLGKILKEQFHVLKMCERLVPRTALFVMHGQLDNVAHCHQGRRIAEAVVNSNKRTHAARLGQYVGPTYFHVLNGKDHNELDIFAEVVSPLVFWKERVWPTQLAAWYNEAAAKAVTLSPPTPNHYHTT